MMSSAQETNSQVPVQCRAEPNSLKEYNKFELRVVSYPRVVTGEKNSPTVAHACRKRRLKWVLPRLGVGAQG
jgi:hypothetical protein